MVDYLILVQFKVIRLQQKSRHVGKDPDDEILSVVKGQGKALKAKVKEENADIIRQKIVASIEGAKIFLSGRGGQPSLFHIKSILGDTFEQVVQEGIVKSIRAQKEAVNVFAI